MPQDLIFLDHLSAAQHQFASEHFATPVMRPYGNSRSVFMYHTNERRTHRWLVDPLGRSVESASFER
jgi:hypothetical protein